MKVSPSIRSTRSISNSEIMLIDKKLEKKPIVFVVDHEESVRTAVKELLSSIGLVAELFSSAESCKLRLDQVIPRCLVLDVRLHGQSGLSLQAELQSGKCKIPVIFISGINDIASAVIAMKAGAIDYFTKPFFEQGFLEAVQKAITISIEADYFIEKNETFLSKYKSLTAREREILGHFGNGFTNKQVGNALGLSEVTIKISRSKLMKKVDAENASDLHRFAHYIESLNSVL